MDSVLPASVKSRVKSDQHTVSHISTFISQIYFYLCNTKSLKFNLKQGELWDAL